MAKIVMDELNRTRDAIREMLRQAQEGCRLSIELIGAGANADEIAEQIAQMERKADKEKLRITEELSETVGKLFLAGLLKRAVVCDSVVAYEAESMLDLIDALAQNWRKVQQVDPRVARDDIRVLLDSMLQNCIVMLEKTINILDGVDISSRTLEFIMELDRNINHANTKAHEALLTLKKHDRSALIRMLRIVKSIENLGDKIKSIASYILFIRTGDFVKV